MQNQEKATTKLSNCDNYSTVLQILPYQMYKVGQPYL